MVFRRIVRVQFANYVALAFSLVLIGASKTHACTVSTDKDWNSTSLDFLSFPKARELAGPPDATAVVLGTVVEQRIATISGKPVIESRMDNLWVLKGAIDPPMVIYRVPGQGGLCNVGPTLIVGGTYFLFISDRFSQPRRGWPKKGFEMVKKYSWNVYAAEYRYGAKWLLQLKPLMQAELRKRFFASNED